MVVGVAEVYCSSLYRVESNKSHGSMIFELSVYWVQRSLIIERILRVEEAHEADGNSLLRYF